MYLPWFWVNILGKVGFRMRYDGTNLQSKTEEVILSFLIFWTRNAWMQQGNTAVSTMRITLQMEILLFVGTSHLRQLVLGLFLLTLHDPLHVRAKTTLFFKSSYSFLQNPLGLVSKVLWDSNPAVLLETNRLLSATRNKTWYLKTWFLQNPPPK